MADNMSKSTKILYFYQYFGTPKGGWSTRVYEMCKRWHALGHEVSIVTSLYDKSDLTASGIYTKHVIEGINVYVVNVRMSNKNKFYYRLFTFFWYALMATLIGLFTKCNAIIASSGPITIGIPALLVKWIRFKPLIFEVRDLWPGGAVAFKILKNPALIKIAYWFEALCYNNSKLIVSCSQGIHNSIIERFPHVNSTIIPNAADVELFRDRELPNKNSDRLTQTYFVYTGTLGLIDDCSQILHAAKELQSRGRNDIRILMIGDGNERDILHKLHDQLQLTNVDFLGQMPKLELINFVRQCRGSILTVKSIPYMDHCSPNKVFDAFAAGRPIIQTTQGWIHELVDREKCGLNVKPNDPSSFAESMIQLTDDEDFFLSCCKNSARLGDTEFNRDRLAKKMIEDIQAII